MNIKAFLIYTEYNDIIQGLSDEQAGQLFKCIMLYASTDLCENACDVLTDEITKTAFNFIKLDIDRNILKYAETVEKRRIAGRKGGLSTHSKTQQNIAKHSKTYLKDKDKNKNKNKDKDKNNMSQSDTRGVAAAAINLLNELIGTNYKVDAVRSVQMVNALLDHGYTQEQIENVIRRQVAKWYGTKFESGLRPATLFDLDRFDEFVNAPDSDAEKKRAVAEANEREVQKAKTEITNIDKDIAECNPGDIRKLRELKTKREWLLERIERFERTEQNAIN